MEKIIYEDEIVEIKKIGKEKTYDIEMALPANNYIANNLIVHNTSGLSKLSRQLGIKNFKEMYDATTLYRPGPLHSGETADYSLRHNGKKKWEYDHPLLEPLTKDTYGLILYQEQVMLVMHQLGAFSWATAEASRKIMTKSKGKDEFNKMRAEFIANAKREHGITEKESEKIFDVVCMFGSYGFNLSHAVEYSIISYWTAWLKVHYPAQFFESLLTLEDDSNKIANYVRDAREFGIDVKTPDINKSGLGYLTDRNKIYAGLDSVRGLGQKTVKKILQKRPPDGFGKGIEGMKSFARLVEPSKVVVEALACSGALDIFGVSRQRCCQLSKAIQKKDFDFNLLKKENPGDDWNDKERSIKMLEYVDLPSEKPAIDYFENPFEGKVKFEKIGDLRFEESMSERWIKGIVTFINFKQEGLEGQWTMFDNVLERRYAHLNISDGTGNVLVHLSPEQYTSYKKYLERGAGFPVVIKGSSIPNFQKIYADAMIVLDVEHLNQPICKRVLYREKYDVFFERIKKKFPDKKVKIIQTVRYKVSKKKKAYARIGFEDGTQGLCFNLTHDIFLAGEIIVFTMDKEPFIDVVKRYS
ncbi:hypothetical protein A3K72_00575 [Candidatus Woesearchaeota archaeon RBG_13_36_6]|nr:MAG: hypothetical protein A3K72_00575 [Candidatus Woesearchaeota archaeon RBG_13_36_6]